MHSDNLLRLDWPLLQLTYSAAEPELRNMEEHEHMGEYLRKPNLMLMPWKKDIKCKQQASVLKRDLED